jgi:serine protease Do
MKRSLLFLLVIGAACLGGVMGSVITLRYMDAGPSYNSIEERQNVKLINLPADSAARIPAGLNFQEAARLVTPAVVHIRAIYGSGKFSINAIDSYLNPMARSSGSGVIISDDGYIVTNHHVIEDAHSLEVVLNNNQRFYAKVIGKDPSTDLALLKVKARNLPFVKYGDSDRVIPGEWVLAVGNPFELTSTVTAGIVSAKARNIRILEEKNNLQVESFIQTDAAVNPGNSGGALVNLKGELVGINTAIATATGGYSGYSFAIPVSLVKKVMDDLLEFGQVQRGLLGVIINDVTAEMAEELDLDVVQGVYIAQVNNESSAQNAGLKKGDVITHINAHPVNSTSELQEWVARNRPGQTIRITYRRGGIAHQTNATLKSITGSETLTARPVLYEMEGATFEDLSYTTVSQLNIDGGVMVKSLTYGKWQKAGLQEKFIITHIDKIAIDNVADLNRVMEVKKGGVLIEGFFANGEKATVGMEW